MAKASEMMYELYDFESPLLYSAPIISVSQQQSPNELGVFQSNPIL